MLLSAWFLLNAGIAKEQKFSRCESDGKTGVMVCWIWQKVAIKQKLNFGNREKIGT